MTADVAWSIRLHVQALLACCTVETIGDSYMAATGLLVETEEHARCACRDLEFLYPRSHGPPLYLLT